MPTQGYVGEEQAISTQWNPPQLQKGRTPTIFKSRAKPWEAGITSSETGRSQRDTCHVTQHMESEKKEGNKIVVMRGREKRRQRQVRRLNQCVVSHSDIRGMAE